MKGERRIIISNPFGIKMKNADHIRQWVNEANEQDVDNSTTSVENKW